MKKTARLIQGEVFMEFDILHENVTTKGEPCYLACIKGTTQIVWLFTDNTIAFSTDNGNVVIPINPSIGKLVIA